MTAEVLAMNKLAAAMAADSKATVRLNGVVKTHDTVNKLFTLSKYHPVGTMVYGNAEITGVPWETIIKVYRDRLRDRSFARVNSYANDFILSLTLDYPCSADSIQDNTRWIAQDFVSRILVAAESEIDMGSSQITAEDAIAGAMNEFEENISSRTVLFGFRSLSAEDIASSYGDQIADAYKATFDSKYHGAFLDRAILIVAEAMRRNIFSDGRSGIVFAGFGDKEIYPSSKAFLLDGYVAGRLRGRSNHRARISDEMTALIRPFAQGEMVQRFMEGIDPSYREFLENAFGGVAEQIAMSVVDGYVKASKSKKEAIRQEALSLVRAEVAKFVGFGQRYREGQFVDPIVTMTQLLPKDELAHLAESFVNLTSLKRRVSLDDDSVGGPIDVAVISKGDGFIWLKRKHYFDKNLNGTFTQNYFKNHLKLEGETGSERVRKTFRGG